MHENAPLTIHEIGESWVWHYTSPSTTTIPSAVLAWGHQLWSMSSGTLKSSFMMDGWIRVWGGKLGHSLAYSKYEYSEESRIPHCCSPFSPYEAYYHRCSALYFRTVLPPLCLPAGSIEREHGENSPVFLESRGWLRHYSVSRVNKPEPISTRNLWSSSALEIIECQISISEDVEIQILLTYT